jgi:hypothetical protein
LLLFQKNHGEAISGYFKHISEVRETPLGKLDPFKNSIKPAYSSKNTG